MQNSVDYNKKIAKVSNSKIDNFKKSTDRCKK